jgi:hypothetical protein
MGAVRDVVILLHRVMFGVVWDGKVPSIVASGISCLHCSKRVEAGRKKLQLEQASQASLRLLRIRTLVSSLSTINQSSNAVFISFIHHPLSNVLAFPRSTHHTTSNVFFLHLSSIILLFFSPSIINCSLHIICFLFYPSLCIKCSFFVCLLLTFSFHLLFFEVAPDALVSFCYCERMQMWKIPYNVRESDNTFDPPIHQIKT